MNFEPELQSWWIPARTILRRKGKPLALRTLLGPNGISHLRWESALQGESVIPLGDWNMNSNIHPQPLPTWSFGMVDLISHPGSGFYDRKCV